jgi:hypothetical protein
LEQPEAVKDLSVAQKGRNLTLSFTLPRLATDGEELSKPLEIEIFRTLSPPDQKPEQPSTLAAPWKTLEPRELRRYAADDKVDFPLSLPEAEYESAVGGNMAFAIRGLTRGFRHRPILGELSNVTHATLLRVSPPLENLEIHTTEKAMEMTWSPPTQGLGGGPLAPLAGYRVYRSTDGRDFQLQAETLSASCRDTDFRFDHTYFYKVGAVFKSGQSVAESEDSAVVSITPRDVFPPAPPHDISALYAAGAVEIIWRANSEPDLAGYNVYRSESQGAAGERLNRALLKTPIFHDSSALPGRVYFYHLTAVDFAGNESGPSTEAAVETR